jgi:anti-sigma regulatory factor (Ser/Thr protein kinase)
MEAQTFTLPVHDATEIGAARRVAVTAAEPLGISELDAGRVALVATELATNLVRHAGGGELLVRRLTMGHQAGLEIVALDRGPGMTDLDEALRDGYSTGGTKGAGLGAVRRLAHRFAVFSAPGAGTAVLARLFFDESSTPPCPLVAGVSVAKPGETACGDAWCWTADPNGWTVLVADGLGHGPDASTAAAEAVRIFLQRPGASLPDLMADMHAGLRHTRGAALGLARLDRARRELAFVGVGNVGGTILSPGDAARSLVSLPGIAGHECRKIQQFLYPWPEQSAVVLYSDGLQTRWTLDRYPTAAASDPVLLAALLYRDFARGRDDVTVVVGREEAAA